MRMRPLQWILATVILVAVIGFSQAQNSADKPSDKPKEPLAGHSNHGEVFNEGPRQKAYLIGGTGNILFPVTTKNPLVQRYVEQGLGQLHGFWYFEAERSFRQAAKLDPDCAIAYWGMAKANKSNRKRSKGFIAEAMKRKDKASKREQMYIESFNDYINAKGPRSQKAKNYVKAVKEIAREYPDDLEADALLGYLYYSFRSNLKLDYKKVDAHLKKVLSKAPLHPVHHYVIHLWDYKTPANALASAARCGQGSPEIAHMWHMPGHIYSRLKRYGDAVFQQEASARVDHKHMIHDRVLPDQIHNFAHNNEWLIRNLIFIGRFRDAVDLAMNMTELPRHPKYNVIGKRKSAYYGRLRLFDVLDRYELWDEVIALSKSTHLRPTDIEAEQIKRLKHLGIAYFRSNNQEGGKAVLDELQQRIEKIKKEGPGKKEEKIDPGAAKAMDAEVRHDPAERKAAAETKTAAAVKGSEADERHTANAGKSRPSTFNRKIAAKPLQDKRKNVKPKRNPRLVTLEQTVSIVKGHEAFAIKEYDKALSLLRNGREDALTIAWVQSFTKDKDAAVKAAASYVRSKTKQVQPQAVYVEILWNAGKKEQAKKEFDKLRTFSGHIQHGSPVFDRLAPIARELDYPSDWRIAEEVAKDVGNRPNLDDLGPFRWHPSPAPQWVLKDADGKPHALDEYRGKPVIVIFYLGYGCLHCAEQIQAFAPMTKKFNDAGISLIAVSTDDLEGLRISQKNYKDGVIPFPLVADSALNVFKTYRVFDDFENIPLHGTFLIDGNGLVRWQDIGFEPFMDADFVLKESQRLLGLDEVKTRLPLLARKQTPAPHVVKGDVATSANWPRFRGPNGTGIAPEQNIPVKWTEKDFNFKVMLPGIGHSSPVVWGDRIFVTSGERKSGSRYLVCIDADSGETLWKKEYKADSYRMHRRNSNATSTPVVDGKHVYVSWATPEALTVMALTHDGNLAWQKDLGRFNGKHGFGVSPILYKDLLILANDQNKKGSLLGLDKNTGATRWNIPRRSGNETYATPVVYTHPNGKAEIIFTNWQHGMTAVDPEAGKITWELSIFEPEKKERSIASPVIAGDLILGTCGFVTAQKHFVAVKPPLPGNGAKPKEVWRMERQVSYLPTPLVKDGLIFLCTEKGIASCIEAKTGKVLWQETLGGTFYGSPVCAGDKIYCASTEGDVYVLAASRKFEVLARNSIGAPTQSTPAIAGGRIIFRAEGELISIGGKK